MTFLSKVSFLLQYFIFTLFFFIKQKLGNINIQFDHLMNQMQNMTLFNAYNKAIQILNYWNKYA